MRTEVGLCSVEIGDKNSLYGTHLGGPVFNIRTEAFQFSETT